MTRLSPYAREPKKRWAAITEGLIAEHPLAVKEIVEVVHAAWEGIFETRISRLGFKIGTDIIPQPQIMGFLLHELIPLEFARRYPSKWRRQKLKTEKDLVYEPDLHYSVEIKTSSHAGQVFGNRSYGQPTQEGEIGRKGKSGYFLTVNFQKFSGKARPLVTIIRFGWLDHTDWIAQVAATGQSARLSPEAYKLKLLQLYNRSSE
jgi:ScaI restriction endonuclease